MKLFLSLFIAGVVLSSCSGGAKEKENRLVDTLPAHEMADYFNYTPQLFAIDPLEFKLNRDDLPFSFDEDFLQSHNVKTVIMKTDLKENNFTTKEEFRWDINPEGQITKEQKIVKGKIENAIERKYSDGLLTEMLLANPGVRYESSIKRVKYVYSDEKLTTVYDIFENNDTLKTDYGYTDELLTAKIATENGKIKSRTEIQYLNRNPIKIEMYKGKDADTAKKTAIYTYTYTDEGQLLYGDHWYPGISNDSYIFEFDKQGRLREITYRIFVGNEQSKVPGKTKSYRYEYDGEMLKRINYFMQATNFSQKGTFDFTYEYYTPGNI